MSLQVIDIIGNTVYQFLKEGDEKVIDGDNVVNSRLKEKRSSDFLKASLFKAPLLKIHNLQPANQFKPGLKE